MAIASLECPQCKGQGLPCAVEFFYPDEYPPPGGLTEATDPVTGEVSYTVKWEHGCPPFVQEMVQDTATVEAIDPTTGAITFTTTPVTDANGAPVMVARDVLDGDGRPTAQMKYVDTFTIPTPTDTPPS